jgi:CubicO group peptidase (beta-lactamase class C family)
MQATEHGKLDLDAPAGDLLKAIAAPRVLQGFDDRGQAVLRPAATPITARHLLTHTAGYGYDTWNPEILQVNAALNLARRPINDAELAATPLLFDPGTRWNYSIGTDVLGRVLEQADGRRLAAILDDDIFAPLGMADTGFLITPEQKQRLAAVHRRANGGFAAHGPAAVGDGQGYAGGGGGLVSSVPDYLTFLRALLNRGGGLIRPESWADMARNQIGDLAAGVLRTAIPTLSFDADFFPGQRAGWGLGFLINAETSASGRSPGGVAWAGLANTYYWIDPTRGLAGVVATQMLPFADPRVVQTLFAYERAAYGL